MKQKVYQILGNLNSFLEGQKYAAGDELTIADLGLLATITSLCVSEVMFFIIVF